MQRLKLSQFLESSQRQVQLKDRDLLTADELLATGAIQIARVLREPVQSFPLTPQPRTPIKHQTLPPACMQKAIYSVKKYLIATI